MTLPLSNSRPPQTSEKSKDENTNTEISHVKLIVFRDLKVLLFRLITIESYCFGFISVKKKFVLKLNPEIWEHTETLLKRSRTGQET